MTFHVEGGQILDSEGEKKHRYKTFFPENVDEQRLSSLDPLTVPWTVPRTGRERQSSPLTRVLCIMSTILMSTNGPPIFVMCITGIRL